MTTPTKASPKGRPAITTGDIDARPWDDIQPRPCWREEERGGPFSSVLREKRLTFSSNLPAAVVLELWTIKMMWFNLDAVFQRACCVYSSSS